MMAGVDRTSDCHGDSICGYSELAVYLARVKVPSIKLDRSDLAVCQNSLGLIASQ